MAQAEVEGLRGYPWRPSYGPADRPLESFYLPALSRALRYDRIAGFFSSYALAVAAQGVARLVARGGRMRLLVGAQLSPEDVEAVLRGASLGELLSEKFLGLLENPQALADALLRERLRVLAWLVAQGRLEVRVVVEGDPYTRQPLASGGYFHAKGGILWDEQGDGVAFAGSINETATAWRYNYETFHVFCSWREPEHFRHEVERFERLWQDAEAGWLTVPLPEAVTRELVKMAPPEPPLEEPALESDARLRWLAQFVRDAPYLVHKGWRVGVETAPIRPFPHQRMVAYDVLDHFPCRRLLADEVGLGKTIEAGFVLRSLLLSGWVRRCLVLVPRSLARQWQEELRERFGIEAPFYDGSRFVRFGDGGDSYQDVPGEGPWEAYPVVIASAQMMRRRERAQALLAAPPWDLVIVDEAHHARRRSFQDLWRRRPNRLLQLLERLRERTRGLLLLTATPMQVHPVEAWDLLRLLEMPGRWQQDQQAFLAYFEELRKPSLEEMDWDTLLPLLREAVEAWGWDSRWEQEAKEQIGAVGVRRIKGLIESGSSKRVLTLALEEKQWLLEALRRHSPVGRLMYRHTRSLLREYQCRGVIEEHIPERRPEPVWLEMTEEERDLYETTEEYVSEYYRRYERAKRGLGFVMRIYRQRLASSLYALKRSLERRREFLLGKWQDEERPAGLEEEDIEEAELEEDVLGVIERPEGWEDELHQLDDLLRRLEQPIEERKPAALESRLQELLRRFDQVLVFTQYTDTLDFLRERLRPTFGSRLGCYSGRGGEVWDSAAGRWVRASKTDVQHRFQKGDLKVLICTEAGGEGLNLQNCGAIVNYDMPWNPMRVEQRIGRIDRLGQRRNEVMVLHFFYKDTVEARVYEALSHRIRWFETVIGDLQPILQRAYDAIQRVAMERPEERELLLRKELQALEKVEPLPSLEGWRGDAEMAFPDAPLSSDQVTALLRLGSSTPFGAGDEGGRCDPYGRGALPEVADLPPPPARPDLVRLERVEEGVRRVGYYRFYRGAWQPIRSIGELLDGLSDRQESPLDTSGARERFEQDCRQAPGPQR